MAKSHKSTSTRRRRGKKMALEINGCEGSGPISAQSGRLNFNSDSRIIDCFAKEWSPEFATKRKFDNTSWVGLKRGLNAAGEGIAIFLKDIDIDDPTPSSEAQETEEFVGAATLQDLRSASGIAGHRRAAWLDDRSSTCCIGPGRSYGNPITATALYQIMRIQRFGLEKRADADRRLIYISNLDPYYILALAETAVLQERRALRDAIWKHLALQTSIRVKMTLGRPKTFCLELHLPCLALRKTPPNFPPVGSIKRKPDRKWTDLSFLGIQTSQSGIKSPYGVTEVQFSFVICGNANERWVGYAFDDSSSEEIDVESQINPCDEFHKDPITNADADLPIWCPREYFLLVFNKRSKEAFKEWEKLVRTVEISVNQYRDRHSSLLLQGTRSSREHAVDDAKQTYDRTQQTMELLDYLLERISGPIKAWERFSSPAGDIDYFSVMNAGVAGKPLDNACISVRSIKETMENMADLEKKLKAMNTSCRSSAKALQLRLELEASTAVKINAQITHFTILIVTPLTLTIAYFSIPQGSVPFKLEAKYFPVVNFLMMGTIQLLFMTLCALPSWWKRLQAMTRMLTLGRIVETIEWVARAGKERKQDGDQNEAGIVV